MTVQHKDGFETDEGLASPALLRIDGIGKSFPGVRALENVSIEVAAGEVHGIVGENGAGKSTLMAIASGALGPDEGSVMIAGQFLERADPELARHLGISVVHQEPALLPDLTVAENIWLGVGQDNRPSLARVVPWAESVLDRWGTQRSFSATARVNRLDTHERFIVEVSRAFAQEPKVLVLDEPTEHLQPEEVEVLFDLIREHVKSGHSVVYISHRIQEIKRIANRISVLRGGTGQGTYESDSLTEAEIVSLIVGRRLDAVFPPKGPSSSYSPVVLRTVNFSGEHFVDVSIEARAGQIIGLAGIEGNGQRDFMRALAGLETGRGTVEVSSQRVQPGSRDAGIAFVPSDRHSEGIISGLSVRENATARHLKRLAPHGWLSGSREDVLTDRIIGEFDVKTPSGETDISSLSGGNQQKVVIGSVLETDNAVILVDEPTQGVDIGARSEIYAALRRAADAGVTVLVLSSDARELAGLADTVLVFSRGSVIESLTGDDVNEGSITARALHSTSTRSRKESKHKKLSVWLSGDLAPGVVVGTLLLVVGTITTLAVPSFLSPFNIQGLLVITTILGFAAVGQVFVLLTGGIDISVGPLMSTVTVVSSFYLVNQVNPIWHVLGVALVLVVCLGVGFVNWALIDVVKLSPIIATLATFMALQGLALVLRPAPGGAISTGIVTSIQSAVGSIPVAFVVLVVVALSADYLLRRRSLGVALRAVGSHPGRARLNGLNPVRVRLAAYLVCSSLAGVGGLILVTQTGVGDATSGNLFTLASIAAAVVGGASCFGGRGLFIGGVLGALLVQGISSATTILDVSTAWQYVAVGVLTFFAVCAYSLGRARVAVSG
ncbi:ATP-binding cassette domain-containing protein [Arthrobacter sp. KNU40]|uniref:ATP-binding cassette domain-containing protein n=1 Tax=Arthrobacter sp. KNU40 TaxID=3447965 RepID=UPI003F6471B8